MHELPSKGLETLELNNFLKVACIGNDNAVRGLQWAFDRKVFSDRRYQVYALSLGDSQSNSRDFDFLMMMIDLGQPVPVETLKKFGRVRGLCIFTQPTPQQLLRVFDVPGLKAVAWDGVAFEKIAEELDALAQTCEEEQKRDRFFEISRTWLKTQEAFPENIAWIQAPTKYVGALSYGLDPKRRILSIGGSASKADIRLPLPGTVELAEFFFDGSQWRFRALSEETPFEFSGDPAQVSVGDRIQGDGFSLAVRPARLAEEFIQMSRRSGLWSETAHALPREDDNKTVAELCRDLLYSGVAGELNLHSAMKTGRIVFADGLLRDASAGAVSGMKALLRMMAWADVTWRFHFTAHNQELGSKSLNIGLSDFMRLHETWLKLWSRIAPMAPPPTLRLRANPVQFAGRETWSFEECHVLAGVCEYATVKDILNNSQLLDAQVIETLIQLRQQGVIEIIEEN